MTDVEGITVNGYGSAGAPPDVVRLSLAAEASDVSVQRAIDRAASGLSALRQALLDSGVAERDLVSAEASAYTEGGTRTRHVARFGLTATVREVARAGELSSTALAAAGEAGRPQRNVVRPLRLLEPGCGCPAAGDDGCTRPSYRLAELAGRPLGPAVEMVEGGAGRPPTPLGGFRMATVAMDAVPVSPGELDVSVVVTVRYAWA